MATSKVKDVLKQGARGWAAGLAGLPGDLEGLARMAIKYGASPGSYVDRNMSETPALPTSEFYNEWLPGGDWETPEGGVAQAIGTALGGVGATKLVKPAVKAADLAAKYGVPLAEKAVANAMVPSQLSRQAGVIKAPGGNWLSGSVEDVLRGLRRHVPTEEALARAEAVTPNAGAEARLRSAPDAAINNWIDKQLTKYVKNDMATERDPVRALAERGVLHADPGQFYNARRAVHPSGEALEKMGVSDLAKQWENTSDNALRKADAGTLLKDKMLSTSENPHTKQNPWLQKVPPETSVNYTDRGYDWSGSDLGFNHLIDELRNATNPNSGLPADLLLKYDALDRVSVPQAVERVAKINEWRAAQKAEANLARANNAATVIHKEYPEQGMKWVELKKGDLPEGYSLKDDEIAGNKGIHDATGKWLTDENSIRDPRMVALRDALKYEGDTMGHCVGGYCEDVASGKSRIYSLRDKKGQPHVTIEVKPGGGHEYAGEKNKEIIRLAEERGIQRYMAPGNEGLWAEAERNLAERGIEQPKYIQQIKGKGNKKPNDEYLPFVQDFVKSGKWSDVGDLQNSGLRRFGDAFNENEIKRIQDAGIEIPTWASPDEIKAIGDKVWPGQYGNPPGKFAQGGLVSNDYDPAKVDALVAQLQAEFA